MCFFHVDHSLRKYVTWNQVSSAQSHVQDENNFEGILDIYLVALVL